MTTSTAYRMPAGEVERKADRGVALWLSVVIFLVFAMIVVGGATRLTDSGLSITEWQPILGAIPPMSEADWQIAFDKYRQIPEYQQVNRGMSMAEFQFIFWWEWAHRFLGRIIGIAFAIPLAAFWLLGRIPRGMGGTLLGLLALGGLQGGIGWYMVQSGLTERVDVSHYRLALHLTTAFVILALLVWCRVRLFADAPGPHLNTITRSQYRVVLALFALILCQVSLGGFVAGLKAGLTYNTWPLMDGELIPGGLFLMSPWYMNLFENITTVQFMHRITAYLILLLAVWNAVALTRSADHSAAIVSAQTLAVAVFVQAALGIWTLVAAEGSIPIGLGLVHQGGAAVVLAIAVWHLDALRRARQA